VLGRHGWVAGFYNESLHASLDDQVTLTVPLTTKERVREPLRSLRSP